MKPGERRSKDVFLNVPYDRGYERLFVALIASLVGLGRIPRCVLEIREDGAGRLKRIFDLMRQCPDSVHDLCRTGQPARFNMPFELGLACSLHLQGKSTGRHRFIMLEREPFRLDVTLSDLKGRDPKVHRGSPQRLIEEMVDVFGVEQHKDLDIRDIQLLNKLLWQKARSLKEDRKSQSIFKAASFKTLVSLAIEGALKLGLIRE